MKGFRDLVLAFVSHSGLSHYPQPSALNPKTLNPTPQALNPEPSTLNPSPSHLPHLLTGMFDMTLVFSLRDICCMGKELRAQGQEPWVCRKRCTVHTSVRHCRSKMKPDNKTRDHMALMPQP